MSEEKKENEVQEMEEKREENEEQEVEEKKEENEVQEPEEKGEEPKKMSGKTKGIIVAVVIVVILALAVVFFVQGKFSKVDQVDLDEEELTINEEMEENETYINVALFGIDAHSEDAKNVQSDAIVIASLNTETKEVKLMSVYGNAVLTDADGEAIVAKDIYNEGVESAVEILNRNLDLNIDRFVTVNFQAMIDVIDAIGGLEVDVKEDEVNHTTGYTEDLISVTGVDTLGLDHAGPQILNGTQATAYCRIRATEGGDVTRTARQREIITKIFEKMVQLDLATMNNLVDKVFPQVQTNFELTEILGYAKDIKAYKINDMVGFPFTVAPEGAPEIAESILSADLEDDVIQFHQQFFPDMDYEPTENVEEAAQALKEL